MTATLSPRWARLLAVALASTLISALLFALPAWAHEGEHGALPRDGSSRRA